MIPWEVWNGSFGLVESDYLFLRCNSLVGGCRTWNGILYVLKKMRISRLKLVLNERIEGVSDGIWAFCNNICILRELRFL